MGHLPLTGRGQRAHFFWQGRFTRIRRITAFNHGVRLPHNPLLPCLIEASSADSSCLPLAFQQQRSPRRAATSSCRTDLKIQNTPTPGRTTRNISTRRRYCSHCLPLSTVGCLHGSSTPYCWIGVSTVSTKGPMASVLLKSRAAHNLHKVYACDV